MSLRVEREQDILNEAIAILVEHMAPDKVARVLSAWHVGTGDYTKERQRLFAGMDADEFMDELEKHEEELRRDAPVKAAA